MMTSPTGTNFKLPQDLPRLLRAKFERKWEPYEVEELRGSTMGIVG